jgi:hypothetical protein
MQLTVNGLGRRRATSLEIVVRTNPGFAEAAPLTPLRSYYGVHEANRQDIITNPTVWDLATRPSSMYQTWLY